MFNLIQQTFIKSLHENTHNVVVAWGTVTLPRKVRVGFIDDVTFGRISRGYQRQKRKKRLFQEEKGEQFTVTWGEGRGSEWLGRR